jgi:hypothetical protein
MKLIYQREEQAPLAGTGDFVPVRLSDGRTVIVSGMRAAAENVSMTDSAALLQLARQIAYDVDFPVVR